MTTLSVFVPGKWVTNGIFVKKTSPSAPPKPLFIVVPVVPTEGTECTFPVLVFLRGFRIPNTSYSLLLEHISSHGYIVVAPGLDLMETLGDLWKCSTIEEDVEILIEVTNWLNTEEGLVSVLPPNIHPDFNNLALAGHSNGGKAAFDLVVGCGAQTQTQSRTTLNYKALIGLDPVAEGTHHAHCKTEPKILTYIPRTFNFSTAVAVVDTGLLDDDSNGPWTPFGETSLSYNCNFFEAINPPTCYFLVKDYGHCDMLNEGMSNLAGCLMCKSGHKPRDEMRKGCGGIIVAFLKAFLEHDPEYLQEIMASPGNGIALPISMEPVSGLKTLCT